VNLTVRDDDNATNSTFTIIDVGASPPCFDEIWVDDDFNSSIWGWQVTHFDHIQDGVDAVCPNGTVYTAAGTYDETVDLNGKELTINGSGIGSTIINASSFSGYAISDFADNTTILDLTLIGTNHYGFKVSHVSNITLENIRVEDSGKTGIDLHTVDDVMLTNIEVVDTVSGFGIMILDSNDITVTDIMTDNNPWGGVSVQTANAASDSISFSGTFDASEDAALLLEKDPPTYYDITNIDIPSKFDYVVYGFREGDNYMQWYYQETLSDAKTFADGLMSSPFTFSGMLIHDIAKENYYVIPGMLIQDAVDDATGTTIYVDAGVYAEQVIINKSLTILGDPGAIIAAPDVRSTYMLTESSSVWDPVVFAYGGTYSSGNTTIWGADTISVTIDGFEIDGGNKAGTDRFTGIMYRNINTGQILNNNIHSMYDADGYGDGPQTFGIMVYGTSEVTVEGNEIHDFSRGGIGISGNFGDGDPIADVTGNYVYGNGLEDATGWWSENGIQFGYGASGTISGNEVRDCLVNNTAWSTNAIIIVDTNDMLVDSNYIENSAEAIGAVDFPGSLYGAPWDVYHVSNVTITNNICEGNIVGMEACCDARDITIEYNDILNCSSDAIDVFSYKYWYPTYPIPSPTNIEIHQNNIVGCGGDGIWVGPTVTDFVEATCNWYGDISGPYNAIFNPNGTGCNVVGNLTFIPWLDDEYPYGDCTGTPNDSPMANFTYTPADPTTADLINFTDNSTDDGIIVNWSWDFDDGNISYLQNPTHQYTNPGNYSVCLIIKDDDDAVNSSCKQLTVIPVGEEELTSNALRRPPIGLQIGSIRSSQTRY
jgi:nitrous oxidase accessory protein NosD